MSRVTFQPSGITLEVQAKTTLLDAARQAGVEIDAPCGGKGTCGNCIVRVVSGQVDCENPGVLSQAEIDQGFVPTCRTTVHESDVVIDVPGQVSRFSGQFSDDDGIALVDAALLPSSRDNRPLTEKIYVHVPAPQKVDGLSDLDRLTHALQQRLGKEEISYPITVMRQIADALRAADGNVTVTVVKERQSSEISSPERLSGICVRYRVTAIEANDLTARHYGIAVDVGTTTVAVQLIDLTQMKIISTCTDYNGQLACGLDIISRIDYARRPDRREELRNRVLRTINRLIRQSVRRGRVESFEISCAGISGNTTMIHLLLGLNPEYIRLGPYTPTILDTPLFAAAEIGIEINQAAPVTISPAVGSYVGGDITAGILCTDLSNNSEDVCLFMDIGTNGEVVLGNREFLLTCACSAGPAFEGSGIKCGMRAAVGAIERVEIDPATGQASCQTIGQERPRGICGSGMISLLSQLLQTGWIDAAGKLNRSKLSEAIQIGGRQAAYILVSEKESATGRPIIIDEQDIENIIRAKAALYAACALMLTQVGMQFHYLRKVYIAGGFGRFLDLDAAITIGLLPNLPRERFHFIGNASLSGSYMALVSEKHRQKQREQVRRMTYIELSTTPSYMDQYTAALFLPHTNPVRFHS
ncbi:MAG TPA: ASKHA domain-containing protein [Syntrophales bacterium]|nr:ASKHA domain-containing protein [Syntrophales bacterium]